VTEKEITEGMKYNKDARNSHVVGLGLQIGEEGMRGKREKRIQAMERRRYCRDRQNASTWIKRIFVKRGKDETN